jgi:hypothetical protein
VFRRPLGRRLVLASGRGAIGSSHQLGLRLGGPRELWRRRERLLQISAHRWGRRNHARRRAWHPPICSSSGGVCSVGLLDTTALQLLRRRHGWGTLQINPPVYTSMCLGLSRPKRSLACAFSHPTTSGRSKHARGVGSL